MASQTTLLGAAGEHFVMSELLRRGFVAALAPVGAAKIDILVTDDDGARLCSIQVKTRRGRGSGGGWFLNKKHEEITLKTLFYCFVDFSKKPTDQPTVFVLPSKKVADVLRETHKAYLNPSGRKVLKRKNSDLRRLRPDYAHIFGAESNPYPAGWLDCYRDEWNLLNLEPQGVEVGSKGPEQL
jgi:hypothetical protein